MQQMDEMRQQFAEEEQLMKEQLARYEQQIKMQTTAQTDNQTQKLQQKLDNAKKSLEETCYTLSAEQDSNKLQISNLTSEKDSIIALKVKDIAILTQKESQLKEQV